MELNGILGYLISFVGGGGLMTLVTWRSSKKKADVEVKVDEIKALHDTIELVYQPTITHLNNRVAQLEDEVKSLRTQLSSERADHQKEIAMMNHQILAISRALGIKASTQIRNEKGQFAKAQKEYVED
jgi:Mg2+ and Co2+ transporter CorA